MRPIVLLFSVLVLTASFVPAPASGSPQALVADAGTSRASTGGAPIDVEGRALFGTSPYAYAWAHEGSASRFADPTAAATSFSVAGLPLDTDVVLTLTVTDATGAVASDTVRHRVSGAPLHVAFAGSFAFGAPDEALVPGGTGVDRATHTFQVPPGLPSLTATLDWIDAFDDLDFELLDPSGQSATGNQGQTASKPEVATVTAPAPGTWTARVMAFASVPEQYTLAIGAPGAASLPVSQPGSIYEFGALDAQFLLAGASGGSAPYAYAWDLDGDGALETAGAEVFAQLPVGEHEVRLRVTDAAGFEADGVAAVHVLALDHVLKLLCGENPHYRFTAMEWSASKGTCWLHGGHHTYFLGGATYEFLGATGFAFTVEQQYSPPTNATVEPTVVTTPIHVQLSGDGQAWSPAGEGRYVLLDAQPLALPDRQSVAFELNASGAPFRFLRVHEPLSGAQGLSGYLDHSVVHVYADEVAPAPTPTLAPGVRELDCARGEVMEDFFEDHPCWFGGVDRYDAPSFFHTYVAGDGARLSRIEGEFTLMPWRTDDFFLWHLDPVASTDSSAFVQVSEDGETWTTLGSIGARYGVPQRFSLELDDRPATFVRLFPEYHPSFDDHANDPALHHPDAYFLLSLVRLTGEFPTGA